MNCFQVIRNGFYQIKYVQHKGSDAGKVILEVVVSILRLRYTFWTASRHHDFSFPAQVLFGALLVLILFILIQVSFPLGKLSHMIHGCFTSIIFCGCIVYHTYNHIKRFSYYLWSCGLKNIKLQHIIFQCCFMKL
ncbi:hypothetical protein MtrunA17_Chr7g0260271 [Medicago truncatula]|uniref:Transmembrane protein n=1 Tax=Medicago truncatula TaxID=3880 RepID=A0A396H4A1_MEDTR|nr:hypothetical protein MtrunA17_Chr7g0260271 [Medicago truncatula]